MTDDLSQYGVLGMNWDARKDRGSSSAERASRKESKRKAFNEKLAKRADNKAADFREMAHGVASIERAGTTKAVAIKEVQALKRGNIEAAKIWNSKANDIRALDVKKTVGDKIAFAVLRSS